MNNNNDGCMAFRDSDGALAMASIEPDGTPSVFMVNSKHFNNQTSIWLPPLYPYTWGIYTGRYADYTQVAIARYIPRKHPLDQGPWHPVQRGTFKEMWALFLSYAEFV